jgi:hypothetical protein
VSNRRKLRPVQPLGGNGNQPPQAIPAPPEPENVIVAGFTGSDGKGYVLITLVTETGPFGVRLPIDRAQSLIEALTQAATQARTGLTHAGPNQLPPTTG